MQSELKTNDSGVISGTSVTPTYSPTHSPTHSPTYVARRADVEEYFDRTAADAWAKLTSTAPVGRIRSTVRAGRDEMRDLLLQWLPQDLRGKRVLDAGCGTGALAIIAAARGAQVIAVDLSPTLIDLAITRLPSTIKNLALPHNNLSPFEPGVLFKSGDLLDPSYGTFDYVVSMDCLIHYSLDDTISVLNNLGQRTRCSMLFTMAPGNLLVNSLLAIGQLFPRGNRSPAIQAIVPSKLFERIGASKTLIHWKVTQTQRVKRGFYTSQAVEMVKS